MNRTENRKRVAERLEQVRRAMVDHHAGIEPDAQFAAGVLERVRSERAQDDIVDTLGWAALRLLPVAAALAVLVTGTAVQPQHGVVSLLLPQIGDDALTAFVVSGLEAEK
jgi:hypothetical protein